MLLQKLIRVVLLCSVVASGSVQPAQVLARTAVISENQHTAIAPAASHLTLSPPITPQSSSVPISAVVSHPAPIPITAAPLLNGVAHPPTTVNAAIHQATDHPAPFGPLPLTFIPVPHVMDTPGDFILGVGVQPITFTTSGPIFTLPAAAIPPSTGANASNIHDIHDVALPTQTTLPVTFIGANRRINLFGEDRLSGIANIYDFTGRTPSHEGLPTYQNLTYQWLYPGIDLTYSGAQGALKSTYIVAPGADPKRIQWHYQHPATVQLREDGSLAVRLASTHDTPPSLVEHAPIAWQEQFGEHIPVQVAYELAADGSISFALGAYDSTKTLLIDPSITYAYVAPTFSSGQSVKVDAQGMI